MNDRARSQRIIEVHNPYTGEVVGTVPMATVDDIRKAFAAAQACKPRLTRFERASIMQKAAARVRSPLDAVGCS